MASSTDLLIQHFLRRVGFGARPDEIDSIKRTVSTAEQAVELVLNYDSIPDDVDSRVGQAGYVGTTSNGAFSPSSNITDARQRWLFRMLHTNRPLQEKMTLFWHNHFATGYNKVNNDIGDATRYMAAKASEDPGGVRGQIEMLRANALGNFSDILLNVSRDVAMVAWLDGRTNTRTRPQENFSREIMELFSIGVGRYTEEDVYAGARVFTGWNLQRLGASGTPAQHYEFFYNANQHDLTAKVFTFPIYANGSGTIPARPAASGMQDGLDLITALASSPHTANYLSTKLYKFFVSEVGNPPTALLNRCTQAYLNNGTSIKAVMRELLLSNEFWDSQWSRYAWPVEFVVRALKDFGWQGFSVNTALTPLSNMGQILFEPPDVAGWDLGASWFSSGAMLSRINFASTLAANQRFNLATAARGIGGTPDLLLNTVLGLSQVPPFTSGIAAELLVYLRANGAWTGSEAQLRNKVPGLVHLVAGSPEYQLQ